jgi:hypothetical protein
MVNVTPEEVIAMRKGQKALDEMTELDRTVAGRGGKHLTIPVCDSFTLRRVAGVIHELATDLDQLARRQDLRARLVILSMGDSVDEANRRIREMTGNENRRRANRGQTA